MTQRRFQGLLGSLRPIRVDHKRSFLKGKKTKQTHVTRAHALSFLRGGGTSDSAQDTPRSMRTQRMGSSPMAQIMGLLERRAAELSTSPTHFALQDVANTLWATCFFSIHTKQSAARFPHAIRHSLLPSIPRQSSQVCIYIHTSFLSLSLSLSL